VEKRCEVKIAWCTSTGTHEYSSCPKAYTRIVPLTSIVRGYNSYKCKEVSSLLQAVSSILQEIAANKPNRREELPAPVIARIASIIVLRIQTPIQAFGRHEYSS
jgi:hypothetical protein